MRRFDLERSKSKESKLYYIERKIEKIEVYEVKAKSCDEAKTLIDEDKKNGKLVDNRASKTLRNVSGLYI